MDEEQNILFASFVERLKLYFKGKVYGCKVELIWPDDGRQVNEVVRNGNQLETVFQFSLGDSM